MNIGELSQYEQLSASDHITISAQRRAKRVVIEVVSTRPTGLFYTTVAEGKQPTAKSEWMPLGYCKGYAEIEFHTATPIVIKAEHEIAIKTREGQQIHRVEAVQSFTIPVQRIAEDPNVLLLRKEAKLREQQHRADMAAMMNEIRQMKGQTVANNQREGSSGDDGPKPKPAETPKPTEPPKPAEPSNGGKDDDSGHVPAS